MLRRQYKLSSRHPFLKVAHEKNVALLELNLSHKNNMLTPSLLSSLTYQLEACQLDPLIRSVILQAPQSPIFSHGLDYKLLKFQPSYIDQVQNLALSLGSFEKPLHVFLEGRVQNAANSLLYYAPFKLAT